MQPTNQQTSMKNIAIYTSLAAIALIASLTGVSCKPTRQSENLDGDYVQTFVPLRRSAASLAPAASDEASVPVYVSPYARSDEVSASKPYLGEESSHAPLNYAIRPAASNQGRDLKTSASYGHGHGHHGGGGYHDHGGWLDMGAWTGGKGSFGWYADYPVGKGHGYGRR